MTSATSQIRFSKFILRHRQRSKSHQTPEAEVSSGMKIEKQLGALLMAPSCSQNISSDSVNASSNTTILTLHH